MEKIVFDSGVQEYRINGAGVLRFNPGDPNVYARFLEAPDKIAKVETELTRQAEALTGEVTGETTVKLMAQADKQIKEILCWIFGEGNDFDKALGGVNLLAVAKNGQRVVTNLFSALEPILVEGAKRCAKDVSAAAVQQAKARREKQ